MSKETVQRTGQGQHDYNLSWKALNPRLTQFIEKTNLEHKMWKTSYLNILVISIPTNITLTGNQTLISLHVSGSVDITPR